MSQKIIDVLATLDSKIDTLDTVLDNVLIELRKDPITWDTWAFCQRYKQTAVGGGTMDIRITPAANETIQLLHYNIILGTYAGGATALDVNYRDKNGLNLAILDRGSYSNTQFQGPPIKVFSDDTTTTALNVGSPYPKIEIIYPNHLRFFLSTIAQNELITIVINAKIESTSPTVTITSSGTITADPAFTSDYEEII